MKRVVLLFLFLIVLVFLWRNRGELDSFTHRLAWATGAFIILGSSVRIIQWLIAVY